MKNQALASALALLAAPGLVLAEDGFTFGIGVNHSSGDYGSDVTTEITTVPVTARLDSGNWSFRASLPWTRISGDPNVLPGTGPVPNFNPLGRGRNGLIPGGDDGDFGTTTGTASGVGDLTLRAVYSVPSTGSVLVDLSAFAKLATADEDKGLGTGASDYGVGLDLARAFGGATLFGGVSYTLLGDSDFIDADDVLGFNAGASWKAGRGQLGLAYDFRESASSNFDDRSEATVFFTLPGATGNTFQIYGLVGLSDGSPDYGAGINYGWKF